MTNPKPKTAQEWAEDLELSFGVSPNYRAVITEAIQQAMAQAREPLERELMDTKQALKIEQDEYKMLSDYFEELKLRFPTMAQIMVMKNQADKIKEIEASVTQARNDALEEAAKICEDVMLRSNVTTRGVGACIDRIRALKSTEKGQNEQ